MRRILFLLVAVSLPGACNTLLPDQPTQGQCGIVACDAALDGTLEPDAVAPRVDSSADGEPADAVDGSEATTPDAEPDGGPTDAGCDATGCRVTLSQPQLNVQVQGMNSLGVTVTGSGCTVASLGASGVPPGVAMSASDGGASGTLTFAAGPSAPLGPALVTLKTSGGTPSATLTLLVESSPGSIDTTFGDGGSVLVSFPESTFVMTITGGLTTAADDGVFVAGTVPDPACNCNAIGIAKLDRNGAYDPTFGNQGKSIQAAPAMSDTPLGAIADPGGGIITVGFSNSSTSYRSFSAVEFSAAGRPEMTFGSGGFFTADLGQESKAYAGLRQDDGRVIAGGFVGNSGVLVRSTPEGGLDESFGDPDSGGVQLASNWVFGLGRLSTGSFIVGEASPLTLVRYSKDGAQDPTYGKAGSAVSFPIDVSPALLVQSDDAVVIAANAESADGGLGPIALTRFRADGVLDPSFGDGGVAQTTLPLGPAQLYDVRRAPDGQFASSLLVTLNGVPTFGAARFTSTGALDTSFGGGFAAAGTVARPSIGGQGVAIDSYGRVLVAAVVQDPNDSTSFEVLVVRYWP